jgi:hypothetical protein
MKIAHGLDKSCELDQINRENNNIEIETLPKVHADHKDQGHVRDLGTNPSSL